MNPQNYAVGAGTCICPPHAQRWTAEDWLRCRACGLPFPQPGIEARRPHPSDSLIELDEDDEAWMIANYGDPEDVPA